MLVLNIDNKFIIFYDDYFLLHYDPTGSHPERPERLSVALNGIRSIIKDLEIRSTLGKEELLAEVHDLNYVEYIRNECKKGFHYIDGDTYVNTETFNVAVRAFTCAYEASKLALNFSTHVMVLPRPPGHHVGRRGRALGAPTNGFCIFNNSAAAIMSVLKEGIKRVLVIDFDAHHGNGTQEIFWSDGRVLHIDIHEGGIYPGTGFENDVGSGEGEGTKVNIPVPSFSDDSIYLWVIKNVILPLINEFKPEFLVISAGFDAYKDDPLTNLAITELTYEVFGSLVTYLIRRGYVRGAVTVLEGGYTEGLRKGVPAYVRGLQKELSVELFTSTLLKDIEKRYGGLINRVLNVLKKYWKSF